MSVKIAFWGMEESCHITENMIVMSWLLAKIRPAHSIFVHRENGWQCIFSGGKDRILFADCGCGRDKKTQNSLKNADVIVAGIHTYPSEWQEIIQFYSQTQKGSLSGRRLCIACKPVKDGYDGQVSYCAGTDRLYPAKRGIGVGVSAGKN